MSDFENLKKKYGERFAKLCRTDFSTILEEDGLLSKIIEDNFAPNKYLYDDLTEENIVSEFKEYIYEIYSELKKEESPTCEVTDSPDVLFDKAGYTLYKCETNEDVLSFKKYYKQDEELCTFRDPHRIETHTIFFAVKKNVDEIVRENFSSPERQDEYGTSVIILQFDRDCFLSIKNRYNHTVNNPDATFSNNLDKIIPGLTESFEKFYGIEYESDKESFSIYNYTTANDSKFHKCTNKVDGVYYCINNIIIEDGEVKYYDKNRYEIVDYFIIDKKEKTITSLTDDSFCDIYKNIQKIEITKYDNEGSRQFKITQEGGVVSYIVVDNLNRIIKYENDNITSVGENFLSHCKKIKEVSMPSLKATSDSFIDRSEIVHFNAPLLETVGYCFLSEAQLTELDLPYLTSAGNYFMEYCPTLEKINPPLLHDVGRCFLRSCRMLKSLDLPNLVSAEEEFFTYADSLKTIHAPKLIKLGSNSLRNTDLTELNLPSLKIIGNYCFTNRQHIKKVYLPKVKKIGHDFLSHNHEYMQDFHAPLLETVGNNFILNFNGKNLSLPNLKTAETYFLSNAENIEEINLPQLISAGSNFININDTLQHINAPMLSFAGDGFLENNLELTSVSFPSLKTIMSNFLRSNEKLEKIDLPEAESIGDYFLTNNDALTKLELPNTIKIGFSSLSRNTTLKTVEAPFLESVGTYFLMDNETLSGFYAPNLTKIDVYNAKSNLKKIIIKSNKTEKYKTKKTLLEKIKEFIKHK